MLYYVASNAYAQTIKEAAESAKEAVIDKIVSNELLFLTHLKKNISYLSQCDKFLIDLNAIVDSDKEITEAVEMIRMMYPETRIIILANTRKGSLIQEFLNMGIYNLITTSDFVILKSEIQLCITTGKNYKDTVDLKSVAVQENVSEKIEFKKNIYKVMIGIAGAQKHIGVTHQSIALATWLRKKGYRVALVEVLSETEDADILEEKYKANPRRKSDYRCIRENYDEDILNDGEFCLYGVDYFEAQSSENIYKIVEKSYNFIILDFGEYRKTDMIQFLKCEFRFIVAGSHDWEFVHLQNIFNTTDKEACKQFKYFFNFHDKETREMICESLEELEIEHIYFNELTCKSVFEFQNVPYYEEIFREYLPVEQQEAELKKFTFFRRKKDGKKEKKEK